MDFWYFGLLHYSSVVTGLLKCSYECNAILLSNCWHDIFFSKSDVGNPRIMVFFDWRCHECWWESENQICYDQSCSFGNQILQITHHQPPALFFLCLFLPLLFFGRPLLLPVPEDPIEISDSAADSSIPGLPSIAELSPEALAPLIS